MARVKIQYISLSTRTRETPINFQIELLALWKWPLGISEINKFTWYHNRSPLKHWSFYPANGCCSRGSIFLYVTDFSKLKFLQGNYHGYIIWIRELHMTVPKVHVSSMVGRISWSQRWRCFLSTMRTNIIIIIIIVFKTRIQLKYQIANKIAMECCCWIWVIFTQLFIR